MKYKFYYVIISKKIKESLITEHFNLVYIKKDDTENNNHDGYLQTLIKLKENQITNVSFECKLLEISEPKFEEELVFVNGTCRYSRTGIKYEAWMSGHIDTLYSMWKSGFDYAIEY